MTPSVSPDSLRRTLGAAGVRRGHSGRRLPEPARWRATPNGSRSASSMSLPRNQRKNHNKSRLGGVPVPRFSADHKKTVPSGAR